VGSLRFKKDRSLQEMVSLAWSSVEKERGGETEREEGCREHSLSCGFEKMDAEGLFILKRSCF
jgi:hypothetical protein